MVSERNIGRKRAMIICGFPGVGKTTMARFSNWVDLESTPFEKNWLLYANVAKHMSNNGYTVMVSTHAEMLDALNQIEARYTVVIPHPSDKTTYAVRYTRRGDDKHFIDNIMEHWDLWIRNILKEPNVLKTVIVLPVDGCLQAIAERWKKG